MARVRLAAEVCGPLAVVAVVALVGGQLSPANQQNAVNIMVTTAMVVALYVFVGNSGVWSFGQVSFVAVGAFAAGILTTPVGVRRTAAPDVFGFLATTQLSNIESLLLAAALGGLFALLVGCALMRLTGLAAGIATFAVLEITYNVLRFWSKIGPGAETLALVPVTTGLTQGAIGCGIAIVAAFAYQHTRSCRLLRASREDALAARGIGVPIFRHRLVAFTISGGLSGFAGALFVHELGSINTDQVYLALTFLTLAMLVVGGVGSLWGATIGGAGLSVIDTVLSNAENGINVGGLNVTLPSGLSTVVLGVIMVAILILAPRGVTASREFLAGTLTGRRRLVELASAAPSPGGRPGQVGSPATGGRPALAGEPPGQAMPESPPIGATAERRAGHPGRGAGGSPPSG
ncbi:MAG: ABC transporter permease subunit [Acidimicrobiales bacterium]